MPILFKVKAGNGYFVTKYQGCISEKEHLQAFKRFFTGGEWIPGINELAIASEARSSSISYDSLHRLLRFKSMHYEEYNIMYVKVAIYAPGDLAYGIARIYDTITDDSPEEVKAFRDIREAIRWLRK